ADRRAIQTAAGDGPLQRRADEDRGVVDAAATVGTASPAVDLVAVVLVVGHPVDAVQPVVVVLHGVVLIVPEFLQAFLFNRHALVALGEDVVPRLIAAVTEAAPAGLRRAAAGQQTDHGADDQGEPFHSDSLHSSS